MEEQGNENQEYPKQEVPRWQSQGMDNIPSFSPPENEYGVPQQRGGKFGSIGTIVITVIISLVLCYAMVSLLGISPSMKQYKADITRLELDLVDVRAVDTAINAELDGLANASIIAQNASTTATQAKELVTTLQADYASLNNSLEALQARATALENNSGDIYDDTIIRGLITAVEEDITAINTTITALQAYDTTNTTNLTALQDRVTELEDIISDIQGDESDDGSLSEINDRLGDIEDDIEDIQGKINDITKVGGYLDDLRDLIDIATFGKANINSFDKLTANTYQLNFNVNESGTFAVILTLYGSDLNKISSNGGTGYVLTPIATYDYGTPKTMQQVLLSPNSIRPSGTIGTIMQWTAGQSYTVYFDATAGGTITCIDIDTAMR